MFLRAFREKIRAKMAVLPGQIDDRAFDSIATLEDYDERYTVPHFGFANVLEFYRAVSSRHVIADIRVPTLIVSALDDPFMGPDCIPFDAARGNPNVFLELGYAWGRDKPTILVQKDGEKSPFDVQGQKQIRYKSSFKLGDALKAELQSLNSKGLL